MAALRPLLSIAREETAALTTGLASSSRVAIAESSLGAGVGKVAAEMNPLAVRQAVEAGAKEGSTSVQLLSRQVMEVSTKDGLGSGDSILAQHLSISHAPPMNPSNLLRAHPNLSTSTSSTQSVISSTIEQDMGQTLREVLGNAGQTGVEEQMDQVVEVAKVLARESGSAGEGGILKGVEEAAREVGI